MQQSRAVPAPIFNARKRPRQAVIAEPQTSLAAAGSAAAAAYPGLMPPRGYGNTGQQQQPNSMNATGDAKPGGVNFRENRNTYSNRQWKANQPQSSGNSGADQRNVQPSTGPKRQPSTVTHHYKPAPAQHSYQQSQPCARAQTTTGLYGQDRTYNFNKQNRNQQPQMPANRATTGYGPTGSTQGKPMYGQAAGMNRFATRGYNSMEATSPPAARESGQYTPAFAYNTEDFDDDLNDSLSHAPTQTPSKNNTNTGSELVKKNSEGGEMNKTAHMLTVRAAGLRRWAKYRDTMQLMFEVFGYLDSAMGWSQTGCKEFRLSDEAKDSITCVFYEIDRQLAKMTRGQWYRVVGTYDQKSDQLRCVSVRPMSDMERPMVQTLVDRGSQELARLTRHMREP